MKQIILIGILAIMLIGCAEQQDKEYYNPLIHKCVGDYEIQLGMSNKASYSYNGTYYSCFSSYINITQDYQYVSYCCSNFTKINESEMWNRQDILQPLAQLMDMYAYELSYSAYQQGYMEGKNANN